MTSNTGVSANDSSYFARPSKIVKPNSRNSSPRNLGRRKTTTAACSSSRTRSVVDHLRSNSQWQNSTPARSRPVSWHPDYFQAPNFNLSPTVNGGHSSCWGFSTAQVNGLITPVAYTPMNEPQIQEFFAPLDDLPGLDPRLAYDGREYCQQVWPGQSEPEPYSLPLHAQPSPTQSSWQSNHMSMDPNVRTAPSSPDCPPVQNIGLDTLSLGNVDTKSKDSSEELVAMGLYDSPAEVQSSSLLFGGLSGSGSKALKLAESFEPTEQECDAEEEEVEGGQTDDDDDDQLPEEADEKWHTPAATDYDSHSIASHMTYGMQPRPEPLATQYLATLRQMNSAYYPPEYTHQDPGYGWI
ncbi:hypothetical protein A1O7_08852 [Cladophialophora yegresii CBS 114405]|uniref:Uncharacterized protein n=1 Tax=Cladophialophora yegresii CBS 114405 TaxID=1182544 RepID=W9VUV1_9EURO|nr:uncharacterized protein A1O7_08852 [Cladophialophora yegresii CBS 114405]EXJ55921.1 hypothetical protein A1O7_08852 [Cladophialophora yegresii CBS 114405]